MSEQEFNERYINRWYTIIFLFLAITLLIMAQSKGKVYVENTPVRSPEPKLTVEVNYSAYRLMELPSEADGQFKSYMDYRKITDRTSKQYALQQLCYTDKLGFRRFNGDYVVAVGTGYADRIGQELIVTLSSGVIFTAIVGDIKRNSDTDPTNRYIPSNGNIIEYIVDTLEMDYHTKIIGDISGLDMFGAVVGLEKK
jgi:hypothetical protein